MHGREDLGWVFDFPQPCSGHLEDCYLGCRTETVLYAAEDTVRMAGVTFELQYYVYNMFKNL